MSASRFPSSYVSGQFWFALVAASGLLTAMSAPGDDKVVQKELESLKGVWVAVKVLGRERSLSREELDRQEVTWTFKDGGKSVFAAKEFGGKDAQYTYSIDPSKSPKVIDFTYVGPAEGSKGIKQFGIYKLEKGTLTLCLTGSPQATEKERPNKFAIEDKDRILLELERPKKK